MESIPIKTCTKCGEGKPLSEFHRSKRSADGRQWACKACAIAAAKSSQANIRVRPKRLVETKVCVGCGAEKSATEFHVRGVSTDGLNSRCKECACEARRGYIATNPEKLAEYRKRYASENRDKNLARMKAWRDANPDRRKEYQRQYDLENAERIAEWKHAWWQNNKDYLTKRLEDDPSLRQRQRANMARYRERNRELLTERQRKRRVDKLGLTVADVDLSSLWTGTCGICNEDLDEDLRWPDPHSKSIDHIVPLRHGGTHEAHNLQWAHLRCNVSKGARMPDTT